MFLTSILLSCLYVILFYEYFYHLHIEKKMVPIKQAINPAYLIGYTSLLLILWSHQLSITNTLLILMGISLSVIDIYYYIVDPLLSMVFFIALLVSQGLRFHVLLPVIILLSLLLLNLALPNQLGFGDVKLLVMWSTVLSSVQMIWLIFFASFFGTIFILLSRFLMSVNLIKIAFVPFLTLGLTLVIYLF